MTWDTTVSDMYIRLVDPAGKHPDVVSHHRVWNGKLFMASLRKRYEEAEDEGDRRLVRMTTKGVYRKSKGYKPEYCNDN